MAAGASSGDDGGGDHGARLGASSTPTGFSGSRRKNSPLNQFLHRHGDAAGPSQAESDAGSKMLGNALLTAAAAGPVLLLLIIPLFVWVKTRSFDVLCRVLSVPSLMTGIGNSAIWMVFTSFVMKKDDCMELVIAYPMLFVINFVYLMLIYGHRHSRKKAFVLGTLVCLCIGYLFYIIRFEAKAPVPVDGIASVGILLLLWYYACLQKDLMVIHGALDYFLAFANIIGSTILNAATFYVVIKKYPVLYFPIISSFIGIAVGLYQFFYLLMKACGRGHNVADAGVIADGGDAGGGNGGGAGNNGGGGNGGGGGDDQNLAHPDNEGNGPAAPGNAGNLNQPPANVAINNGPEDVDANDFVIYIPEEHVDNLQDAIPHEQMQRAKESSFADAPGSKANSDNLTIYSRNAGILSKTLSGAPVSETNSGNLTIQERNAGISSDTKSGAPVFETNSGNLTIQERNAGISSDTKSGAPVSERNSGNLAIHVPNAGMSLKAKSVPEITEVEAVDNAESSKEQFQDNKGKVAKAAEEGNRENTEIGTMGLRLRPGKPLKVLLADETNIRKQVGRRQATAKDRSPLRKIGSASKKKYWTPGICCDTVD